MNVLALVQSIVSLTRADTTERFSAQVGARVDALARAHRFLANSGWAQADIADIIGLEIPADLRTRVTVSGPATPLPAQQVQPLVLMFHELMANARQHGALASSAGALTIDWSIEPETLTLNWREQGGREPLRSPRQGLGLSLVAGVITRQLGGTARMDWHKQGLRAELRLPLAAARTGQPGVGDTQFGVPARKS
jgi:two-component sensor histidine kinase